MTSPSLGIRRLLASGALGNEVVAQIGAAYPDLETRAVPEDRLSESDLAWADAFTGFRLPDGLARSNIVWVHSMNAGVDSAVPALRSLPRNVLLTRTVGGMPRKMGQYVLAHVLADAHRLAAYRDQQVRREWCRIETRRIEGAVATIMGTGAIGAGVASALAAAGFVTCGVNRTGHAHPVFSRTAAASDLDAVPEETAVLVNTLPLTPETEGSIGLPVLGRLQDALFVSVGRGACVEMDDLRQALDSGRVRRAVLDVLPVEPPPADAWYWDHPRVVLTPHVAAITDADDVVRELSAALDDLRAGRHPRNAVDLVRGY